MNIIYKKKIYNGMAELRDYERDRFIKSGKPLKVIFNDEFMMLTPAQLKKGIFINTQKSIINAGQTYNIYGWRWKPTGRIEEQFSIPFDVKSRLAEEWKKLALDK
jgi:hypothetical protein